MSSTTSRTLQLLSLLQNHRFWSGAELATRLEVSERTLRRDVDRLRELGYPVEARRGTEGGYQLAAGAAMPPLLLDDEEAIALVVGLHSATQGAVTGLAEASARALAKLSQVMPVALRHRVEALAAVAVPAPWDHSSVAVDPEVLGRLAQACRDTVRTSFGYVDRHGEQTDRYVEPHQLVLLGRRWYVVAYDMDRRDWRTFRLDRVRNPSVTRGRFERRTVPGGDAAAFVQAGIEASTPAHEVEVVVDAPADRVAPAVGHWGTVEAMGPDRCRLHLTTESLDWALLVLGSLRADFTVVRPAELIALTGEWGTRLSRAARRSR